MPDSLSNLRELQRQRNKARLLWRAVKRLQGPCKKGVPNHIVARRKIGGIWFSAEDRAGSHCTMYLDTSGWCSVCLRAWDQWKRYFDSVERIHRLLNDDEHGTTITYSQF